MLGSYVKVFKKWLLWSMHPCWMYFLNNCTDPKIWLKTVVYIHTLSHKSYYSSTCHSEPVWLQWNTKGIFSKNIMAFTAPKWPKKATYVLYSKSSETYNSFKLEQTVYEKTPLWLACRSKQNIITNPYFVFLWIWKVIQVWNSMRVSK